jgi:hypothetical protein
MTGTVGFDIKIDLVLPRFYGFWILRGVVVLAVAFGYSGAVGENGWVGREWTREVCARN